MIAVPRDAWATYHAGDDPFTSRPAWPMPFSARCPMPSTPSNSRINRTVALVAALFGVLTVVSGARVLLGADPGYVVFAPLLYFNTAMGVVYIAVGWLAWRGQRSAMIGAGAVAGLNSLALMVIAMVAGTGGAIAPTSLGAMTFRVVVWLVLLALLVRPLGQRVRKD